MLITSGSQRVKASFLLQSSYLQNANEGQNPNVTI